MARTARLRRLCRAVMIVPSLLLLLFLMPVPAAAESTIGVIIPGDIPYYQEIYHAWWARMKREGYEESIEVIIQKPYPDPLSLRNAVRKLVAAEVDVLVVYGAPVVFAAIAEKTRTPVVYAAVYDPLVREFSGKNLTGISSRVAVSSLLRYLRGVKRISNLGVVYSAHEEDSVAQAKELVRLGEQYGMKMELINLVQHQDARTLLAGRRADAMVLTNSVLACMASAAIFDHCRESKIPCASFFPDRTHRAVVTFFPNPTEQGEKMAEKVIRILGGIGPDKVRQEASSNVELIFNLREATNMGLRIPMDLVTEATRLIQ